MAVKDIKLEGQNVSVLFPLRGISSTTQSNVGGTFLEKKGHFYLQALNNISVKLEAGDRLGLIGSNGSGKTTLLQTLAGIIMPTLGTIDYIGHRGNALSTSVGFRPEATGRQNIKLKYLMSGSTDIPLEQVVEDVLEFTELGSFIDMPMNKYSAGMKARLTFALATAFNFDIVLLDEWLGAGDMKMLEKVQKRMEAFFSAAAIAVLASHSDRILTKNCNLGLVLLKGNAVFFGNIEEALQFYKEQEKFEKNLQAK